MNQREVENQDPTYISDSCFEELSAIHDEEMLFCRSDRNSQVPQNQIYYKPALERRQNDFYPRKANDHRPIQPPQYTDDVSLINDETYFNQPRKSREPFAEKTNEHSNSRLSVGKYQFDQCLDDLILNSNRNEHKLCQGYTQEVCSPKFPGFTDQDENPHSEEFNQYMKPQRKSMASHRGSQVVGTIQSVGCSKQGTFATQDKFQIAAQSKRSSISHSFVSNPVHQPVFQRLYQESRYKKKIKDHIQSLQSKKQQKMIQGQKSPNLREQEDFYYRMMQHQQLKEEKAKEQRRLEEFKKELDLIEANKMVQLKSHQNQKFYQQHVKSKTEVESDFDYLSSTKADIMLRMQVDIERRKLEMEAKVQMKELEQRNELSQMFQPALYPAPKRSKSNERILADQRQRSMKRFLLKEHEQAVKRQSIAVLEQKQVVKRNKSKKAMEVHKNEIRLRNALEKGVSAMELWKLVESDPKNTKENESHFQSQHMTFDSQQRRTMSQMDTFGPSQQSIIKSAVSRTASKKNIPSQKTTQSIKTDKKTSSPKATSSRSKVGETSKYMVPSEAEKFVKKILNRFNGDQVLHTSTDAFEKLQYLDYSAQKSSSKKGDLSARRGGAMSNQKQGRNSSQSMRGPFSFQTERFQTNLRREL